MPIASGATCCGDATVSDSPGRAASAASLLDAIGLRIRDCTLCVLSETRNRTVPGEGSATAEVMFIGEGPGREEDEQGRPFVGRAGKLLDELIASIGMRREDVYILNMVKCRPPGNRNPDAGEMSACSGYLDEQLAIVDPVLLVTLGAVPLTRFAPGGRVSAVRGQIMEYEGRALLPTYHPAYALRNSSALPTMRSDFRRIPEGLLAGIRMRLSGDSAGKSVSGVGEAGSHGERVASEGGSDDWPPSFGAESERDQGSLM